MNEEQKKKHSWLTSLLTGWGVRESWAKVIAGAIVGALAAAGVLTLESCSPVQVKQAASLHTLYHVLTDTECQLCVPQEGRK